MRGRIRPSKPASILSMIVGIVFVFIGLAVVIPEFGGFGYLWTLMALGIAVFSAINTFTAHGVSQEVVEFDAAPEESIEMRLEKLEKLKSQGMLSEAEYREQRNRILTEL